MFQPFHSPEDAGSGGNVDLSVDDILNVLNKSDDENNELPADDDAKDKEPLPEKEEDVEEEKEVEELDELAELEEELKEPTDDDLELKTPVQRRQLMKDYPDIFKKHPGLESTIYRERAYTELLPTINDAKEAASALNTLDRFEADLKQGKTTDIMKAVMADDPQSFAKLADNYMENLAQVDERAYHHVLGNITKDIVAAMIRFGKEKEDTDIQDAATSLYQFMFNSTKWENKKQLSAQTVVDDPTNLEREKLNKERQDWEQTKLNEHTTKLMGSIDNQIKGTIEKSIDPREQMTPFVKTKAIEEVLNKASNLLRKDNRFQSIINQLSDKASKEKYSDESMTRIRSAYFTKYKSILIPVIKSVRADALKGSAGRIKVKDEVNDTSERANRDKPQSRNNSGTNNDRNKPLPGQSSLDFLMRN